MGSGRSDIYRESGRSDNHRESGQSDDYLKHLGAAVIAALLAGIATFASGRVPVEISAAVTVLAALVGWLIGRILTHENHRLLNGFLAVVLIGVSIGLVVTQAPEPCAPKGVTCFVGECEPYSVYAQNRYKPYGTAVRVAPRREAVQVASYQPNQLVPVDGWVRTAPAYEHNGVPFNSDIWFHLTDDRGWVSFAGVRAEPTTPAEDPTDSNGGPPAPAPAECRGTYRSNG